MRYPGPKAGPDFEPIALLEPRQIAALKELLSGATVKEAAETAGVHRSTVHRWQRRDLAFRAVYNRRLYELQQSAITRVHQMVHSALDKLEEDMAHGELSSSEALRFLESTGLLNGQMSDPGPASVDRLQQESLDRLAETASEEAAAEWIRLLDERAEKGNLPFDGSLGGILATLEAMCRVAEEGELPEDFEPEGHLDDVLRKLGETGSWEALQEWRGVTDELDEPGSDLSGVAAMAFWLTAIQMKKGGERDEDRSGAPSGEPEEAATDVGRDDVA